MKKFKLIKKADFLVLAGVIFMVCLFFFLKGGSQSHLRAYVYEGDALVQEIELDRLEEPMQVSCAGGRVTVQLKKGEARILSSDCPSQTCVHTGALTKSGDTAVCVPNQVTLTLRAGGERQYQTY